MQDRTASLIARAATLQADVSALCTESRALIDRVRQRRFSSPHSRLRRIQGGSIGDPELIAATITGAPLCLACITKRTGIATLEVETNLTTISRAVRLVIGLGPCGRCRTLDATFTLPASAHSRLRQASGF